jgi:tetraacyldisaccharide 4'-kinase
LSEKGVGRLTPLFATEIEDTVQLLSAIYGEIAWRRRLWYVRRSDARRRLMRPVVSVGGLSAGGSGKTPLAAHLARLFLERDERPAVLSRGYGRRDPVDGVVVVRDASAVRAGLDQAGDEPLMLAHALEGAAVLVCPDRYLAGRLAETRLGCTVHVLDDGFQHLALDRDVDLLIVTTDELGDPRVLPAGRLRERVDVARAADALLVPDVSPETAAELASRLGVPRAFALTRHIGGLCRSTSLGHPSASSGRAEPVEARAEPFDSGHPEPVDTVRPEPVEPIPSSSVRRVVAVAGIAQPQRFFDDVRHMGINVAETRAYRDHHLYRQRDLDDLRETMRSAGAEWIVTTEKDFVRMRVLELGDLPLAWVRLEVTVEPAEEFRRWLFGRLASARAERD